MKYIITLLVLFIGQGMSAQTYTHYYDALNRLVKTEIGACTIIEYTYDEVGNMLTKETRGGVAFQAKVFLQGSYAGGMMVDKLRQANLIPTEEPYEALGYMAVAEAEGLRVKSSVFSTAGNDAIVDWVFVELREVSNNSNVVAARPALLQRDGDIVDLDGASPLRFVNTCSGDFYIAVRHRNHLGIMTATPITLGEDAADAIIDFTSPSTLTYGTNAQKNNNGTMMMWGGNTDGNTFVRMSGPPFINDASKLLAKIGTYTSVLTGEYSLEDVNMDGIIRASGPIFINDNTFILSVLGSYTNVITEQLP